MSSPNKVVQLRETEKRGNKYNNPPRVQEALDAGDPQACLEALTAKQQRFCTEYPKDLNASRAVLRAGYKTANPNRIGHELMQKEGVRFAIDGLMADRAEKVKVDANFVLRKIIRSLERAEEKENETAVLRASELLAKHLGMFIDKTEVSGPEGNALEMERRTEEDVRDFTSAIARLVARNGTERDDEESEPESESET